MNKINSAPPSEFDPEFEEQCSNARESEGSRIEGYARDLERQYAVLPMAIFADLRGKKLTYRDVCFFCYLLVKQGKNARLYWSVESLSLLTGIPQTGVKQSLGRLLASGHITRRKARGATHTVCLTRIDKGKGIYVKGKRLADIGREPIHAPRAESFKSQSGRERKAEVLEIEPVAVSF